MSRGEPRDRPDTIIDSDPDTLSRVLGEQEAFAKAIIDGQLASDQAGQRLFNAAQI